MRCTACLSLLIEAFSLRVPAASADQALSPLVRRALSFVPEIDSTQVVILDKAPGLRKYLLDWGYSSEVAKATEREVKTLAEFTIDHHYPIFINADTNHYQRILKSCQEGKAPVEAARVLASDLFHEFRHVLGEEEESALAAQVLLLTRWRAEGLLTIADPYIAAKRAELSKVRTNGLRR